MLGKLQKMRKDKKGFTLVELIVVLVILGILIAMLVPSLTGYIDRAHTRNAQAEGKLCVTAAQTLAEEYYAEKNETAEDLDDIPSADITALAEVEGEVTALTIADGKVTNLVYTASNDIEVTWNGTSFTD